MESFLSELILAQRLQGLDAAAVVHGDPLPDDPDWLIRVPVQWRMVYTPIAMGFRSAMTQAIQRFQPDVLHLHMPNVAVFWLLTMPAARQIPWVVHWHSDVVVSTQSPLALRVAYMAYRPFEQAILELADRIVATSQTYLEVSEPLAGWRYKCRAIPLGINTDKPLPPPDAPAFEWEPHSLRLLSIGRLAHYKGFETLIKAVAATPGLQLVIAGDGENRQALKQLIRDSTPPGQQPSVQLLGEVSESLKHQLLDSCEAFCMASRERTEAFGVVLLEAMVHSKPCIVADLPGSGMPWVVKMAGAGLSHIALDDVASWTQVLSELKDNRARLAAWGEQGRRGLEKHFSIEACANAIFGQYANRQPVQQISQEYQIVQTNPTQAPERAEVLIVIPARNEAATIATVVQSARAQGWQHILVIDDNSTDTTGALAQKAGAKVIRPTLPTGAWGAMQLGLRYALAQGFHAVITIDADGQHEVSELPKLLSQATQGDVIIGAHPQRISWMRKLAWRWFSLITGLDAQDLTSGFRYYNRSAMQLLSSGEATLLDYQDIGVLLMARRAGLRILEVPVQMHARISGHSRIFSSWLHVIRYMVATTVLCMSRWQTTKSPRP
jgi:glycosyltransferase involved in cell wall biosynthesis